MSVIEKGIEGLLTLADKTGVAVIPVKDGHMMVFTKKHIEGMLEAMVESNQDKCIVFVKDGATIS